MVSHSIGWLAVVALWSGLGGMAAAQSTNSPVAVAPSTNSPAAAPPASAPDAASAGSSAVAWSSDLSAAMKQAEAEKKMVVVEVSPDWNISGKKLEGETFTDAKVAEELKAAVLVRINPEASDEAKTMAERLKVSTFPSVLILNYKGTVVVTLNGFQEAATFAPFLRQYVELFQENPLGPAPPELTPEDALMQAKARKPDDSDLPPRTAYYYLLNREEVTVRKDGSSSSVIRNAIYVAHPELVTDNEVSGVSVRYDASCQKIHCDYARLINARGESENLDFSQVEDKPFDSAGDVSWDERRLVVPSRKLESGEILDYEVKTENQPRVPGHFELLWVTAGGKDIVVARDLILHFPAELNLSKTAVRCDLPIQETKEADGTTTWEIKSSAVPPGSDRLFLTEPSEGWQGYLFHTPWSWDELAAWYRGQLAGRDTLGKDAKDLVAQMKQQEPDAGDLALKLCHWVKKNIRYYPIDFRKASFQPHLADETFHYGCGDDKDMALLLQALLREAGIPSSPILLKPGYGSRLEADQPMLAQFDHCLVAAQIDGKDAYLDPMAEVEDKGWLSLNDANAQGLKIGETKAEIVTLPPYQPRETGNSVQMETEMHDDGSATTRSQYQYAGTYGEQMKAIFARVPAEQARETFAQNYQKVNQTLTDFSMSDPHVEGDAFTFTCVTSVPQFARPTLGGLMFTLGEKKASDTLVSDLSKPRTAPFRFYPSDPVVGRYVVKLPPGTRVLFKPDDLHFETPFLSATQTFKLEGDTLEMNNMYVTKDAIIPASREDEVIGAFQEIAERWQVSFIVSPIHPPAPAPSTMTEPPAPPPASVPSPMPTPGPGPGSVD